MTESFHTWIEKLSHEKQQPYFRSIMHFLSSERQKGKCIHPKQADIFNALKYTPYQNVQAVIIGQDPYHGIHQAHGLSFSVLPGVSYPPSLKNIFKELHNDLGVSIPTQGCLTAWAKQGVLLLNSVLTVEAGKSQSHANIGWQTFTDQVIRSLNNHPNHIVFLLWGAYAQKKTALITNPKHLILKTTHPSPFSAHSGFLGSQPFSKTNKFLKQSGQTEIDWAFH